jgi:hypothetical protein
MLPIKIHMKTYKAIITMLILVFSLSPCSVKRNVLDIFDVQYISGLNKVKTTSTTSVSCDFNSANSSRISVLKASVKLKEREYFSSTSIVKSNRKAFFNEYSGYTTGNSPPKYILFKRLKLYLI